MDGLTLSASGDAPVVCWGEGQGACMKLDPSSDAASGIARPAPRAPWLGPVAEVKGQEVCVGTRCKPIGAWLAQAIAAYTKNLDADTRPQLAATSDLRSVIVDRQLWALQADRTLALKPPARYHGDHDTPAVSELAVAGELVVASWSNCAGPCTVMQLVDSAGRNKGKPARGGGAVFQLDPKRFVVTSEYGEAQIFELGTGKPRGALVAGDGEPTSTAAIRIDDETFVVMTQRMTTGGRQIVKIRAPGDPSLKPAILEQMYLPGCTP